ncbi:MAG TPA: acyl-CoA dehydrogenase family protein [Aldersonia sp.]
MSTTTPPSIESFRADARAWLAANVAPRPRRTEIRWGAGSDRVSLFRDTSAEEERAQLEAVRAWQRKKFDAGFGAISWPAEYGGAGMAPEYEVVFRQVEAEFVTPMIVEALSISVNLEARTILHLGTPEQKQRWIRSLRRGDELCCQLFSEPGAGSDLGSIALRAVRDGDEWLIDGQKVWTSGAQFADIGYLVARTDPHAARQRAFTAFLVPMHADGVTVRPLRQMTGGAAFNEVFFDNVRISDSARLGEVGTGWAAMMTTLAYERSGAAEGLGMAGDELVDRLVRTAAHNGRTEDPVVRQRFAEFYGRSRMRSWLADKVDAQVRSTGIPGAEGSLLKLAYTRELQAAGDLAGSLIGPAMVADTGAWGTYAWSAFVSGVPGLRLGGGTDEIQKNTVAERVLGLPREPR